MKSFTQFLQAYLSQFGSLKTMVWVVALAVIAAYGLLDTYSKQTMGNPYLRPEHYAPSIQQEPYPQLLQQPVQQSSQYQSGSQPFSTNPQQQMPQVQHHGGYPNESDSHYPSHTRNTYSNSQNGYDQQKEGLNYGY